MRPHAQEEGAGEEADHADPKCSVEERYGHFADGSFTTADSLPLRARTSSTPRTWTVATNGATSGLYWGPGSNPQTNAPTQQITGLQWVRGARNCSY